MNKQRNEVNSKFLTNMCVSYESGISELLPNKKVSVDTCVCYHEDGILVTISEPQVFPSAQWFITVDKIYDDNWRDVTKEMIDDSDNNELISAIVQLYYDYRDYLLETATSILTKMISGLPAEDKETIKNIIINRFN